MDLASTLTEQVKTISIQTTNGERQTVQVNIPRGVRNGHSMRYGGLGDNMFNTLARGDLYVHFVVRDDPRYRVENHDLIYPVTINCLDAMAGISVSIPSLDNKVFDIAIPAGSGPGTRLRIPGNGLYHLNNHTRGHLIAELIIKVPAVTDATAQELIKQLKTHL
jgi:DnaJ-class molecular chaperone